VFTGPGLLFGILVIGIYLLFGICYLEFSLNQLLREWIRKCQFIFERALTSEQEKMLWGKAPKFEGFADHSLIR
jgi:hypothetical protein